MNPIVFNLQAVLKTIIHKYMLTLNPEVKLMHQCVLTSVPSQPYVFLKTTSVPCTALHNCNFNTYALIVTAMCVAIGYLANSIPAANIPKDKDNNA